MRTFTTDRFGTCPAIRITDDRRFVLDCVLYPEGHGIYLHGNFGKNPAAREEARSRRLRAELAKPRPNFFLSDREQGIPRQLFQVIDNGDGQIVRFDSLPYEVGSDTFEMVMRRLSEAGVTTMDVAQIPDAVRTLKST